LTSAAAHPGFGVTTSPTKQELIRFAHLVIGNAGIPFGPTKIARLVLRFRDRFPNGSGYAFFLYLAGEARLSEERRADALCNPDIAHALAHFDPTPAVAIRNVVRQRGY